MKRFLHGIPWQQRGREIIPWDIDCYYSRLIEEDLGVDFNPISE